MGVGHAPVVALAALGEEGLGPLEEGGVDEGLVGLVADVAEGDFAQVAAVAQEEEDRLGRPAPAASGAESFGVELGGDGGGPGALGAVAGEDAFDEGELGGFDGEVLVVVEAQPVGDGAAGPAASGGFSFHAGDDPVDDGGPFVMPANTPRSWTSIRPVGVEVSMGSVAERNATPADSSSSRRPTRTFKERAKRSTR
jgi:hypothetical protein